MRERTIYSPDPERLGRIGCELVAEAVFGILHAKKHAVLAVPGGRSVQHIFEQFRRTRLIDWRRIHIFMVDERLVEITSPESNYKLAYDTFIGGLLNEGSIGEENLHPFQIQRDSPDWGIADYSRELESFGGIDILILSSGEDGHVGALYPMHHSIRNDSRSYFTMHDSPKPPKDRMTGSRKLFESSGTVIAFFVGEAKRDAYRRYLDRSLSIEDCPVKLIRSIPNRFILTDLK